MSKTKTLSARTSGKTADARKRGSGVARKPAAIASAAKAKTPKLPKAVASAVRAARGRKAVDIVVLDLRKTGGFTDYFVICSGTNSRQISAIADAVNETLRTELGERPVLAEGLDRSEWILLDYFDFVVHVFSTECRAFYDLERLWGNAERYEIADEP
jgi:ribosome-associated protein